MELLIVIAILAVLSAAVVLVLNPAELIAQARDSERVSDMKSIQGAVNLFTIDSASVVLGSANTLYLSLPDSSSTCASYVLPTLPVGWNYHCVPIADLRRIDGNGWIPVDLSSVKGGSPLPSLPIDPVNSVTGGKYYTYAISGVFYEVTALMEAVKHDVSVNDGGSLPAVFQVGSSVGISPSTRDGGMVGYWKLDEGSGATAYDSSGYGNNCSWNGLGSHYSVPQVGSSSGQFNGSNDFANCGTSAVLNLTDAVSWGAWIYHTRPVGISHDVIAGKGMDASYAAWVYTDLSGYGRLFPNGVQINVSTGPLVNDQWTHLFYVFDGSWLKVYANGVLISNVPAVGKLTVSAGYFGIGHIADRSDYWFQGLIDDVRVYNRVLSGSEVKAIYENPR